MVFEGEGDCGRRESSLVSCGCNYHARNEKNARDAGYIPGVEQTTVRAKRSYLEAV